MRPHLNIHLVTAEDIWALIVEPGAPKTLLKLGGQAYEGEDAFYVLPTDAEAIHRAGTLTVRWHGVAAGSLTLSASGQPPAALAVIYPDEPWTPERILNDLRSGATWPVLVKLSEAE